MEFSRWRNIFVILVMAVALAAGISFALNNFTNQVVAVSEAQNAINNPSQTLELPSLLPPKKLSNPPAVIKSIYVTGYSAGTKSYLNYLSSVFKNTEINSVVIDIKGSDGYVSYGSTLPDVKKYNLSNYAIKDINALIEFLHSQNIYVIGRIAVFEDPVYSRARPELAIYNKEKTNNDGLVLWKDNNGLSWLDPSSKDAWNYIVSLANDAFFNHGFDEVNFDYVRFPTDGNMENIGFPIWDGVTAKAEVIKGFFTYARQQLSGQKISVDLFGQTTTSLDDMGIGQVIENAFGNFDYICPMVYPSHYAKGFVGFENPAIHPYGVVKYSMDSAFARLPTAKFRPWLQDFNMGAVYTAEMVKQEIQATQDSLGENYFGFMLWNSSNIYTQGAVLK